jgi:hypothetical protein
MPPSTRVITIQEVVNHQLRFRCDVSLHLVKQKYVLSGEDITWVRALFHGTGATPPEKIYTSEIGFMQQLSGVGTYGRGTYFAWDARYSDSRAFRTSEGNKQLILAQVITAKEYRCLQPDTSLTTTPYLPNSTTERFDSLRGKAGNGVDDIWVVYENTRAYPSYLITYQ